jgi:hypothetical protein
MSALSTLPETAASVPPAHTGSDEPAYRRLTDDQRRKILVLHDEGLTQVAIAEQLGIHQGTVSRIVRVFAGDNTDLARRYAKATALNTVRRVVDIARKGKDDQAIKAAKVHMEIAEVIGAAQGLNVGVQVVIGMPGQPVGPTLETVRVVTSTGQPPTLESAETLSK